MPKRSDSSGDESLTQSFHSPSVKDAVATLPTDKAGLNAHYQKVDEKAQFYKIPLGAVATLPTDEIELKAYYKKVDEIARHIRSTMEENGVDFRTHQTVEPNPWYDRIPFNGGIALRGNGVFDSIMTPLGQIELSPWIYNTDDIPKVMKTLKTTLGLEVAISHERNKDFGLVFYVTKDLQGNPLPKADLTGISGMEEARFNTHPSEFHPYYDASKELWQKVKPSSDTKPSATPKPIAPV